MLLRAHQADAARPPLLAFDEAQRAWTRRAATDASAPLETWSARGFCNFYGQLLSCATLRGLGSLLLTAAARIRQSPHATWGA